MESTQEIPIIVAQCPIDSIADRKHIRTHLKEELTRSGMYNTDRSARRERAGAIYRYRDDGRLMAVNFPASPGTDTPCRISWTPDYAPEGADLIAIYHTHPFDPAVPEILPAGCGKWTGFEYSPQGSQEDWDSANNFFNGPIPTYIIDQQFVMRLDAKGASTADPNTWEANTVRKEWNTATCGW